MDTIEGLRAELRRQDEGRETCRKALGRAADTLISLMSDLTGDRKEFARRTLNEIVVALGDEEIVAVRCIVVGEEWEVTAMLDGNVSTLRYDALRTSNNTGRPPEEFEVRREDGSWMAPDATLRSFGLTGGEQIYISPRVGFGGAS